MPSRPALLALLSVQAGVFVAIGGWMWWISGRPLAAFVTMGAGDFIPGILFAAILVVSAAAVYFCFPEISEYLVRAQARTFAFLERRLPLWAIMIVALGAGIGEEALFRGGIQTLAGDYVSTPLAIAGASAVFALVHFARPIIAAIIFTIGVLFGYVYWITDSLAAVMIAHALYDVFALWYVQKEMHRLGVFAPRGTSLDGTR